MKKEICMQSADYSLAKNTVLKFMHKKEVNGRNNGWLNLDFISISLYDGFKTRFEALECTESNGGVKLVSKEL